MAVVRFSSSTNPAARKLDFSQGSRMTEPREQPSSRQRAPQTRRKPGESSRSLLYAFIVVFFGITAVTLSQQNAIGLIPLKNLLKNELHADRAATAAFFFWLGLAWYFKPFFGIFTDAFPFLGTRRKSYIVTRLHTLRRRFPGAHLHSTPLRCFAGRCPSPSMFLW